MDTTESSGAKRILVVGDSGAIGSAVIQSFSSLVGEVVGVSRGDCPPDLMSIKNFRHCSVDLSSDESVESFCSDLTNEDFSFAVFAAGIHTNFSRFGDADWFLWKNSFEVNFFSQLRILQATLNVIESNKGRVVFLLGGGCAFGKGRFSSYSAAKTALARTVENLSLEYPAVSFFGYSPGCVESKLLRLAMQDGMDDVSESDIVSADCAASGVTSLMNLVPHSWSGRIIHRANLPAVLSMPIPPESETYQLRRVSVIPPKK